MNYSDKRQCEIFSSAIVRFSKIVATTAVALAMHFTASAWTKESLLNMELRRRLIKLRHKPYEHRTTLYAEVSSPNLCFRILPFYL